MIWGKRPSADTQNLAGRSGSSSIYWRSNGFRSENNGFVWSGWDAEFQAPQTQYSWENSMTVSPHALPNSFFQPLYHGSQDINPSTPFPLTWSKCEKTPWANLQRHVKVVSARKRAGGRSLCFSRLTCSRESPPPTCAPCFSSSSVKNFWMRLIDSDADGTRRRHMIIIESQRSFDSWSHRWRDRDDVQV